jgi:hypothetical protein
MRAAWLTSVFGLFDPSFAIGKAALRESIVAIYSSRVEEIVWKVAEVFQGFVET